MKKLLALVLSLLFMITIVACDQTSETTTLKEEQPSSDISSFITETTNTVTTSIETIDTEISTDEEVLSFTVKFDSNGGSYISDQEVYEGEYLSLIEPIREGYEFIGWFTSEDEQILETTEISSNITVFAKWIDLANDYYDDYLSLSVVHTMDDGEDITVSGVVYYMTQNGYYIQDNTANLFIFTDRTPPTVELGSRVVVKGVLTTYREVKQIKNPVLIETNLYEQDIMQEVTQYEYNSTTLIPGKIYQITGEVRIEDTNNTAYLYDGNTKIAEIYYKSLEKSIEAIKAYEGEIITVDLLYYAVGDEVERYAFQGNSTHIQIKVLDDYEAIQKDTASLPDSKTLFGDFDFESGYYGSIYEVVDISETLTDYISYFGSSLSIERPLEGETDVTGTITIQITLNEEVPMVKIINITVKAIGSGTSDLAYYESASGLSGWDLFYELNEIINNGFKQLSYDDAKWVLEESDKDPNNPNNVILVYTRESVKGEWDYPNWNREHTWPQSKLLTSGQKADMHNLKPSDVDENSRRGNLPFGYMSGSGVYEPHDDVKGDVARIVFYMATMYPNLDISLLGDLDVLMQWHIIDPVDDFERNRNEVIYTYQKNRNPYIDNPDYVELVWGIIG